MLRLSITRSLFQQFDCSHGPAGRARAKRRQVGRAGGHAPPHQERLVTSPGELPCESTSGDHYAHGARPAGPWLQRKRTKPGPLVTRLSIVGRACRRRVANANRWRSGKSRVVERSRGNEDVRCGSTASRPTKASMLSEAIHCRVISLRLDSVSPYQKWPSAIWLNPTSP
jgi:hypothetical protein